jgi:predicted AlkP superfamily pyrophosphatase or phosphodiesterase
MKTLKLFIFIDAFGWEIIQRHSFLDDIAETKIPLGTIFGYSSTCDPTIITGKLPREHGHFSFFYYNPKDSPFRVCRYLSVLPKSITRRGRVRRILSRMLQRYYGYTGYFQIYNMPFRDMYLFDYSEKRDLYQEGGINGGQPTIFSHLREQKIPFYLSDWRQPEEQNIQSLKTDILQGDIQFGYLYLAAMDAVLHQWGTENNLVDQKIEWYDQQIHDIHRLARQNYGAVEISVFSDHGMTDVTETCDLMNDINSLGLRFGKDYAAVYDSTMARFWYLDESSRKPLIECLQQCNQGKILSDAKLYEYGCDFPENKYGDIIYMLNPGVLLCPSFMGEFPLKGMHGYDPNHKDSKAMFVSTVKHASDPKRLDDLYGIMRS